MSRDGTEFPRYRQAIPAPWSYRKSSSLHQANPSTGATHPPQAPSPEIFDAVSDHRRDTSRSGPDPDRTDLYESPSTHTLHDLG